MKDNRTLRQISENLKDSEDIINEALGSKDYVDHVGTFFFSIAQAVTDELFKTRKLFTKKPKVVQNSMDGLISGETYVDNNGKVSIRIGPSPNNMPRIIIITKKDRYHDEFSGGSTPTRLVKQMSNFIENKIFETKSPRNAGTSYVNR